MIVDLADVLSDIKLHKKLEYDEIYQFYKKNSLCSHKESSVIPYFVTKKYSTRKLYFKMNWFGNNLWLVYSKEFEGELCKACVLFDPVENNVNRGIFVKRVFRDFSKPEKNRQHAQTISQLTCSRVPRHNEDHTTHVDHDVNKQKRFDRNAHTLNLIFKVVSLCSKHCHCVVTATIQVIYFQGMVISPQLLKP